jgi:hypothetical protein
MPPLFYLGRIVIMQDEIITIDELYLQDIVCATVFANPHDDDILLYNKITSILGVESMDQTIKILQLIKMNKLLFNT